MKSSVSFLVLFLITRCVLAGGAYIEYVLTGENNVKTGNMYLYYQDGNSRSEMKTNIPQMPGGGMSFVVLYLKNSPGKSFRLDEKNKTYVETEFKESGMAESEANDYEVTVLGKEKVNGYSCTHLTIKKKTSAFQEEMWTTTEIKDFEKYKDVNSKYTTKGMYKALKDNGADGFPVRMKTTERSHNMVIDLVKAESRENPASLFSLDGYAKSTAPAATPGGDQMKDMIQKIQNMTPEERQKYMQQMQEQSQPHK